MLTATVKMLLAIPVVAITLVGEGWHSTTGEVYLFKAQLTGYSRATSRTPMQLLLEHLCADDPVLQPQLNALRSSESLMAIVLAAWQLGLASPNVHTIP